MNQIKTVIYPITCPNAFDKAVNGAIAEGWKLLKREVITKPGEISESFNQTIEFGLYAELEKDNQPHPEEITL